MATSTIFNFNFNNSEIVDSTGQWYDATTGTPTTEFINHDGNTALLQRAYIAGTAYTRDINPVFFQSRDPTFTAHTYTIELQLYPLKDPGGANFGPESGPVLDFNPDADDEEGRVRLNTSQGANKSNTFYWREYGLGPDSAGIPFLTVTAADGTYNRWYSIRIERVDDGTNTGATIKIYVDGTLVVNETLTYAQDARRGRIGDSIRYTYRRSSIDPQGAGVAIDNFKLTAGIAPSSVVDVSLANLQRNNANLLSFIKGKVPTVNDGTLTIQKNGTNVATFTANASTNATANITVPTKTSDLTNDSGFITEDTTKIPLAGSNQISGSLVPSTDGTVNLGSSSYFWKNSFINNIYAKQHNVNTPYLNTQVINVAKPNNPSLYLSQDIVLAKDLNGKLISKFRVDVSTTGSTLCSFYAVKNNSTNDNEIFGYSFLVNTSGETELLPDADNSTKLGRSATRWKEIWCTQSSINSSSDERQKQQIKPIDNDLLDAWENVNPIEFKWNDAVAEKGDNARIHTGYIAQNIQQALTENGVNPNDYGLFLYDEWGEEKEEKDEQGNIVRPYKPSGNAYGLRYTEALVVECMYLRRCIARLTARIEELEKGKEQEASK